MVCGLRNERLLIASHIKSWAMSSSHERLDSRNGLLLCALHDKLFDSGLISFDDNGEIILSDAIDEKDRSILKLDGTRISLAHVDNTYLESHRETRFQKGKLNL